MRGGTKRKLPDRGRWRFKRLLVVIPLIFLKNLRFCRVAFPAVVLALSLAIACSYVSEEAVNVSCSGLEGLPFRDGLISQSEAEDLAAELLEIPAPEVSGTEIQQMWSSCLTTLRSYERDVLNVYSSASLPVDSPDRIGPPDMPVWTVQVKGSILWTGGTHPKRETYGFSLIFLNAETGDSIAGTPRWESLIEPAVEFGQGPIGYIPLAEPPAQQDDGSGKGGDSGGTENAPTPTPEPMEEPEETPTPTPQPTACLQGENDQGVFEECFVDAPLPTPEYPALHDQNLADQTRGYEDAKRSGKSVNPRRVVYVIIHTIPGSMDDVATWLESRDTVDLDYENNYIHAGVRISHMAALAEHEGVNGIEKVGPGTFD